MQMGIRGGLVAQNAYLAVTIFAGLLGSHCRCNYQRDFRTCHFLYESSHANIVMDPMIPTPI